MLREAFFIALVVAEYASAWEYSDQGNWSPTCLKGLRQSPIPLEPEIAEEIHYTPLIFEKYFTKVIGKVKNNGHSAEVRFDIPVEDRPEIKGGNLPNIYRLDHMHFHWSSEHTINNHRFPLELHLVHYNKKFPDLKTALKERDGVAVFAVMFGYSPDDFHSIDSLMEIVDSVKDNDEVKEVADFNIMQFLPHDTAGFYRYYGSLTTPDCTEGVLWTVFTNLIPISKKQLKIFSSLEVKHRKLDYNYRKLQPINDRKVYLKVSPIIAGAGTVLSSSSVFTSLSFSLLLIVLSKFY